MTSKVREINLKKRLPFYQNKRWCGIPSEFWCHHLLDPTSLFFISMKNGHRSLWMNHKATSWLARSLFFCQRRFCRLVCGKIPHRKVMNNLFKNVRNLFCYIHFIFKKWFVEKVSRFNNKLENSRKIRKKERTEKIDRSFFLQICTKVDFDGQESDLQCTASPINR